MNGRALHTTIMLISAMALALSGQALAAQGVESPQDLSLIHISEPTRPY